MAKKRKTLPKDFAQIVQSGSLADLQAVYDRCDINAYGGDWKGNALTFPGIPEEFVRWAVACGMDINAEDEWGKTPLLHQSRHSTELFHLLVGLGADINRKNKYGRTPLFEIVTSHLMDEELYIDRIRLFIDHGADVNSHNQGGIHERTTPLDGALETCRGRDIIGTAMAAEVLLAAGAKRTRRTKSLVREIGEQFEYNRDRFPDRAPDVREEQALARLYELFEVEPVARQVRHDGHSPISVPTGTLPQQWEALWNFLVPGEGHAATVQGEIVRIIGKVRHEIVDNGAMNWCRDYKRLPQALPAYFAQGTPLPEADRKEMEKLAKGISAHSEPEEFVALAQLAVRWIELNPTPVPLKEVDYQW